MSYKIHTYTSFEIYKERLIRHLSSSENQFTAIKELQELILKLEIHAISEFSLMCREGGYSVPTEFSPSVSDADVYIVDLDKEYVTVTLVDEMHDKHIKERGQQDQVISELSEVQKLAQVDKRKGIGVKLRYKVMKRDGFQCVLCGSSGKDARMEIDHRKPVCAGGDNHIDNLQTLCFECNRGKGDDNVQ